MSVIYPKDPTRRVVAAGLMSMMFLAAHAQQATAHKSPFTVVNSPKGGRYVYGTLPGHGTLSQAVLYMLRQVHGYFGNRPAVGKFFESHDKSSVATFFTVAAKNLGNKPMTGLLIVNHGADNSASGAVLFDTSARFSASEPRLMRALAAAWRPLAGDAGRAAAHPHATGVAPLTRTTGGDQSASIGLPAGWRIRSVASGTLNVVGDHGEMVFLGMLYQGFRMGPDPFTNFVNISNRFRGQHGLPPGTYHVINTARLSPRAIEVTYRVDFNDGIGPRRGSVELEFWGPGAMAVNGSNIPERYADAENATMNAVIASFRQNGQIMSRLRQGAMTRVQNDIKRAKIQNEMINARRRAGTAAYNQHISDLDAQDRAIDAHDNEIDRSSKVFQDYILDRSVVRDTQNGNTDKTVADDYADSLVRNNPNRFQIVPNQDLIEGKDY